MKASVTSIFMVVVEGWEVCNTATDRHGMLAWMLAWFLQ